MRLIRCFTLLALLTLLCTCDSATSSEMARDAGMAMESPTIMEEMQFDGDDSDGMVSNLTVESSPDVSPEKASTAPKIIYTASARARVEQLDTALAIVSRTVAEAGGYLASQHRRNSSYEHTVTMEIRLPADHLSSTLELLPLIAQDIDYQNLDSRDVTAQWLDLESRLQTKRDVRDRYIDVLRNRAQKVEDILNAEDKIRVITEEIESKEGQLRYLRDQVSLSTLTLELYETQEYRDTGDSYRRSFGNKLLSSLAFGWEMIQELVLGLVAIWPLLLIGGVAFWGFRRWRRKGRG
ncbi:DUF4349 domain-containing protein [Neolewinella agarilytica]|nr:DUF4349 domain-containing protein [Neolewinella agarilytica]